MWSHVSDITKPWHHHWESASSPWSGRHKFSCTVSLETTFLSIARGKKWSTLSRSGRVKVETVSMGGWWKVGGEGAEVTLRARCLIPLSAQTGVHHMSFTDWYLAGFSSTSGIVQLSKTIDAGSVRHTLLSDPECFFNKGQRLGQFNTDSPSCAEDFNICWLTVATSYLRIWHQMAEWGSI